MFEAEHNQTLPGLGAVNTTRRTLHLPAGLLQPATTYVFAFTAYVINAARETAPDLAQPDLEPDLAAPDLASTAYVRVTVRSEAWQPRIAGHA